MGSNPQPPDHESDALTTVPRCPTRGQDDILLNMTALSESKSVKKCRSYFRAYLFHRHFQRELIGFKILAHIVSAIVFFMLKWIILNSCLLQEDILHNMTALSESKSVQKCRSNYRAYLSLSAFSKTIDWILKTCSGCIHYRFLMLPRILFNFSI